MKIYCILTLKKLILFLKDSQNLIQETESLKIEKNAKIYFLDFESFYTNIRLNDALSIITNFFKINEWVITDHFFKNFNQKFSFFFIFHLDCLPIHGSKRLPIWNINISFERGSF